MPLLAIEICLNFSKNDKKWLLRWRTSTNIICVTLQISRVQYVEFAKNILVYSVCYSRIAGQQSREGYGEQICQRCECAYFYRQ